ncbi:hypothetical protein A2886_01635 [candidate division WWE3 bacterium RIFCSPHIGHO2_01_FULL_42_13]|uniref:Uncharacterized protein n=1 Tax=candidate division WWE3 bacterium RIFCSPHIGHO2_01_FULL_42_13 TaxID=1802617 RepID=A0A1F4USP3_UNCKA|nr:MAG: hypothetical protein A2886_01635 [candidate division WWE3 bacterium RIFCSPHIGHO2_01_FULL_42_13]
MDIQVVLIFILALLTVNLVVVGVYVVLVLKELRETLRRANGILDNAGNLTDFLANPLSAFSGILEAVMKGYKAVQEVRHEIKAVNSIRDEEDED